MHPRDGRSRAVAVVAALAVLACVTSGCAASATTPARDAATAQGRPAYPEYHAPPPPVTLPAMSARKDARSLPSAARLEKMTGISGLEARAADDARKTSGQVNVVTDDGGVVAMASVGSAADYAKAAASRLNGAALAGLGTEVFSGPEGATETSTFAVAAVQGDRSVFIATGADAAHGGRPWLSPAQLRQLAKEMLTGK